MNVKTIMAFLAVSLMVGCTTYPDGVVPPTAKPQPQIKKKSPAQQPLQPQVKKIPQGPQTFPIDNGLGNFKVEPTAPAIRAEPLLNAPVDVPVPTVPQVPAVPSIPQIVPPVQPSGSSAPELVVPPVINPQLNALPNLVTPPTSSPTPVVLEDASMPAGSSPAIVALVTDADRIRNSGDLDGAVVGMERALRIDPRNPTLTYKLAQLRLKQSKPQLAEELAGKAALLSGSNLDLKRKSWLLIADARQRQHHYEAAKEALAKAESFFGH
ncbi:tetratricopeptide repeat protein [Methylomonas sp. AM2-LC]|uniref:tetratricopeptide repeat protein n=1 Tax=Methylomonas sp. AM2-LC TaxID=3153301 RepID=UPI003264AD88